MNKINIKEVEKELKKILKKENLKSLEVGFLESAKYPNGQSVAEVAYWNNYGLGVPTRPFFTNAVENNAEKWNNAIKSILQKQEKINFTAVLDTLGNLIVADIQKSITNIRTPPNSKITIQNKKSSNPLINTGLMRSSVTYRIVK